MFDWEDQEIANIIWGEADNNIVTYPEESENKAQSFHEDPDKSVANEDAAKSKNSDQDKDPGMSENQDDDGGLCDIIGNSWANIESFDDLNHIFSNDELVDHASLDSTDEFWAPSRHVLDNAVDSSSLGLDSINWEVEALDDSRGEFNFNLHRENQPYGNIYEKEADSPCYSQKMLHSRFDAEEIDAATDLNLISEETAAGESQPKIAASINKSQNMNNWSRPQMKHDLKSQKINNHRRLDDAHGTWAPPAIVPAINIQQFEAKSVPNTSKKNVSSALDHKKMPQRPTSSPYQQLSSPYFATYPYRNISDQCTDLREKNYRGKSTNAPIKPPKMTPQEKIDKLRKRQQMRAMLAIQKQQQQLSHQVPVDYTSPLMSFQDGDQILNLDRGDFKPEENIVPTYDPSSPLKQDDSCSISVEVDDQSMEDTVLYQLQNTVTKLDMNIRLCIRDSLFRLARSAMQRHSVDDPSTANRIGETNIAQEDISNQESFMRTPNSETNTNEIDRAVAHLLFHRPIKSRPVAPKMITSDPENGSSSNLPPRLMTKCSHNVQNISTHVLKEDLFEQSKEDMLRNQKMKQKMVDSAD